MEVIAKTSAGVMIAATEAEVKQILNAVNGNMPDKIDIGQRIPAIDYASTITKIKSLQKHIDYTNMLEYVKRFNHSVGMIQAAVESAANIEV